MYKLKVYSDFNSELKKSWNELENNSDCYIFQTFNWQQLWQKKIGEKSLRIKPLILTIYKGTNPLAIFPFGFRKKHGIKIIEFLGGDQNDYNCIIYNKKLNIKDLKIIWLKVKENLPNHDVLSLLRLTEKLNLKENLFLKLLPSYKTGVSNYALLDDSWDIFKSKISKKKIKENARKIKSLESLGILKFIYNIKKEEQKIIDKTIKLKSTQYYNTGVRNIFNDTNVRSFYQSLAYVENDLIQSDISALKFRNEYIATHIGMIYSNRYYYLMPTYSDEYSYYSPGRILLQNLIEESIHKKIKIFDFMVGEEAYKRKWSDSEFIIFSSVVAKSFKGYLYKMFLETIIFLKNYEISRNIIKRMVTITRSKLIK